MINCHPNYFINAKWGKPLDGSMPLSSVHKIQKKIVKIILTRKVAELKELQQEYPCIRDIFCIQIDEIPVNDERSFKNTSLFGLAIATNNWDFIHYIIPQLTPQELDAPCSIRGAPLATCLFKNNRRPSPSTLEKVTKVVTSLLKGGAHPNLTTFCQMRSALEYSPIVMAVDNYRHPPLIEILIAHGAKRPYYFEGLNKNIFRQLYYNNEFYKKSKTAIKIYEKCKALFYYARRDDQSLPGKLPKELHFYILSFFSYIPHSQALISNQKARVLWQEKKINANLEKKIVPMKISQ